MNAYERKAVHDFVSEKGFFSTSEGLGKERHIVLFKSEPEVEEVEDNEDATDDE
jgi:hypothetical protein